MPKIIVSNTGPLISLEKLTDGYEWVRKLYDKIFIPYQVLIEVSFDFKTGKDYLKLYGIEDLIEISQNYPLMIMPGIERLELGETHAISLALHLKSELLIEDRDGRRMAQQAGLKISGIAGQVLKALNQEILNKQQAFDNIRELYDKKRLDRKTYTELAKRICL